MRFVVIGRGRMGVTIKQLLEEAGDTCAAFLDQDDIGNLAQMPAVDAVIDFSAPGALEQVAAYCRATATPLVSAVTGYTGAQMEALQALGAHVPVLHSANFSLGIAVMKRLLAMLASTPLADWDIEIMETHHNRKADAPSGTAKLLFEALNTENALTPVYGRQGICGPRPKGEVGIHAMRGGSVAGEHTVAFFGEDETVEITHKAASRRIFGAGALEAARRLAGRKPGWYTFDEILFGGGKS